MFFLYSYWMSIALYYWMSSLFIFDNSAKEGICLFIILLGVELGRLGIKVHPNTVPL